MPPKIPSVQLNRARNLRRDMTSAEDILWRALRNRGLGLKFRRQLPIGSYIADFACIEKQLVVELDGRPHETPERIAYDQRRDAWLRAQGWTVLRIPNDLVIGGGTLVLDRIKSVLAPNLPP